jgi:hypothetical protein
VSAVQNPSRLKKTAARLCGLLALGLSVAAPLLQAFPPAPYYTVFGTVRDENGLRLDVAGAVVALYRNHTEVVRQDIINSTDRPDQNYQFRLKMEMDVDETRSYSSLANTPGTAFTIGVVINNITYYPLEVSGPVVPTIGKPGDRVRLDLTLGVDSDGDGIPDSWEISQLFAAGYQPGPNGWDLSLLDRNGDLDGDGISNYAEYIAGTFASDPTDFLSLQITARFVQSIRFRFFAIASKTYSLEMSTDLQTWTAVPAYLSNPADPELFAADLQYATDKLNRENPPTPLTNLRAETTDYVNLYAPLGADVPKFFYRLKVR